MHRKKARKIAKVLKEKGVKKLSKNQKSKIKNRFK
jgi:hypothetical protein